MSSPFKHPVPGDDSFEMGIRFVRALSQLAPSLMRLMAGWKLLGTADDDPEMLLLIMMTDPEDAAGTRRAWENLAGAREASRSTRDDEEVPSAAQA